MAKESTNIDIFDAIINGNLSAVEAAIAEGVGLNSIDRFGNTPLMEAIANEKFSIIDKLIGSRKLDLNVKGPVLVRQLGSNLAVFMCIICIQILHINTATTTTSSNFFYIYFKGFF